MSRRGKKAGVLTLTDRKTQVGRSVATEREKRRLAKMNEAYQDLRSTLPEQYRGCDTKLDLLRGAVEYIRFLQKCLTNATSGEQVEYLQSFSHTYNECHCYVCEQ
ncbi:uncharacterized protein LOC144871188 [Branchiostoma floridae x Branchiostoma japonicum]